MSLTPATAETLRQALATVVAVPVTPFGADGSPDWAAYAALTRRLIDGGITVITPNGNTGEFYALSQAEAGQVVETAASAANNQAELLAGVGYDIATAVEAAGHARDHGARMIMIHQPVTPTSPVKAGSTTTPRSPATFPTWASSCTSETSASRARTSRRSPTGRRTWSASSTASATPARSPPWPGTPRSTGSPGWPARPS